MRQHYLPRCYLYEFCGFNKSLYSLNIEPFKYGKIPAPKLKNPVEICCESNFYSVDFDKFLLTEQLANAEKFSVEKGFHWYENDYGRIIKKIKSGLSLNYDDVYTFSYSLIDFKIRNRYWRENGIEAKKHAMIYQSLTKIENDENVYTRFNISKETAIKTIKLVKDKLYTESSFSKQLHLNGLLHSRNNNSIQHRIAIILMASVWKLWYSPRGEFITCDNPGICIDHNEQAHNTRFAPGFLYAIPLTPKLCLLIDDRDSDIDFSNSETKTLQNVIANPDVIRLINRSSTFYVNKNVLAYSKEALNAIIPELQKKFSI